MTTRTRTMGMLSKAWTRKQDFNPPAPLGNGAETVNTLYPSNSHVSGTVRSITDVLVPDFKRRRASGEVFMNPVTISSDAREGTAADVFTFDSHGTAQANWGKRVVTGAATCVWSNPPVRPAWFASRISDAKARTLLMAHSKVAQEDFLSLVTVAEAGKTASMIARPFGVARDLIARVYQRRANLVARGMTLVAATTAAWLESRFGWKPLLYELDGIWKAYINGTHYYEKPVRLVARAGDKNIHWNSGVVTDAVRTEGCRAVVSSEYDHEARVSSGVLYELHDESLEIATARRMGLRLEDVPSSLWEATPLSFVIDRFVDVGAWLKAIQPKPGVTVKGSWTTSIDIARNHHQVIRTYVSVGTNPTVVLEGGKGSGAYSEEIKSMVRVGNPVLPPLPTVNYRDLNLTQQIDHVALITQRLLGLRVGSARI